MKRIVSGIQPTNRLTLGNYLGAIKQFVELQNEYEMYIFIADLHALSVSFDPKTLYQNKINLVASYQALGLDFSKNIIFYQSDVSSHTALYWILTCHTTMGELNRMTQFKDKSAKAILSNGTAMVPTGIFMYPVLMAGDILLYDADYVPVGSDQKQHVELTRDIAIRMNKKYGDMFKIPEPLITKNGARIMDLVNPSIKMSKSNSNEKGTIFLSDAPRDAYDKIMSSKTDSLNKIIFDPNDQPGISNLLTIYSCLLNVSVKELVTKYTNKNYGEFKKDLANIVSGFLKDFQTKYDNAIRNIGNLNQILEQNASKCEKITNKKIHEIYRLIGLAR